MTRHPRVSDASDARLQHFSGDAVRAGQLPVHFGSCHALGSGVSQACSSSVRGEGAPALPAFAVSEAVSPAPGRVARRGVPARGCAQPGSRARQPALLAGAGQRRRGCCVLGHVWAEQLPWAGVGGERSSGCIPGRGKVKQLLHVGQGGSEAAAVGWGGRDAASRLPPAAPSGSGQGAARRGALALAARRAGAW